MYQRSLARGASYSRAHILKSGNCPEQGVAVFFEDDAAVLAHVDEAIVCPQPLSPEGHDAGWATRRLG